MSKWGRKEYQSWPSRRPVWSLGALSVAFLFLAGVMVWKYESRWSFAEREYLGNYLLAETAGRLRDQGHYKFVGYADKKGNLYIASGDEIERGKMPDGQPGYRLTNKGIRTGAVRLDFEDRAFSNTWMRRTLGHVVYGDQMIWGYIDKPVYASLIVFALLFIFAVRKDLARRRILKYGRRLRGPELMTTAEFNAKLGQRKGLTKYLPDGLAFINDNRSWADRLFRKNESRWVRIPREREAMHLLVMGDSGHGKSATIRHALRQIEERGETAIVYDPAMEYLPEFYDPKRGDVILNPLDARCPFWTLVLQL